MCQKLEPHALLLVCLFIYLFYLLLLLLFIYFFASKATVRFSHYNVKQYLINLFLCIGKEA